MAVCLVGATSAIAMNWLDLSFDDPAENLALDEAILLTAEQARGQDLLRVWVSAIPCVVLGAGCILTGDVNEVACLADKVPILRRSSGGGTVLLGPGCLAYSLVMAYDRTP